MVELEELYYRRTELGDLVLRRRREPLLGGEAVLEVKLGDEYLMSSLFTVGETALAELGLASMTQAHVDVAVGGLGLGYTAAAVLKHDTVSSLLVIEALEDVVEWHQRGLVPLGASLTGDPRCRLAVGDFFELAARSGPALDSLSPGRRFHAILLDIDHSPRHVLHPQNADFYQSDGLRALTSHLHPGGVFALWSNDPPDDDFSLILESVFAATQAHVVEFANPYTGGVSASTVYVAHSTRSPVDP